MSCRELFAKLSEYIDGDLPEAICDELEVHLSDCEPCQAFLGTLRKTVEICRRVPAEPLQQEMREELRDLLQAEIASWKSQ